MKRTAITAAVPNTTEVTRALRSALRCNISWFFSSASKVIRLVSRKTIALSKAMSYRCAQMRVGFCFFCQFNAS